MAELLRFEDVSFSYGGKDGGLCVLDSMSLHVHEGEFWLLWALLAPENLPFSL